MRTLYVLTVDFSASATNMRPALSKVIANGTPPAESLITGRWAGRPSRRIGKTSTVFADLVVTTSARPSGVNATWPGELLNSGTFSLASPSERWEPLNGTSPFTVIRNPWTLPSPPAFMTYASPPETVTDAGKSPPEETTWRSVSVRPWTRNEVTVPLPALTASSNPDRSS